MTPRRAGAAARLGAVVALLACAACGSGPAAPEAALPPPPVAPSAPLPPSPSPESTAGLLDSRPATLDALRAEQALRPVAVQVPGSPPAPVDARTTDPVTGGLDLPDNAAAVAWWASGASPGTGAGSVVLAAHVSYQGQTGPFTRLSGVAAGSPVVVTSADGSSRTYQVQSTRSAPKTSLDRTGLFRTDGPPVLVLVTCGGEYDKRTRSYADNVVVTAVPV